MDFHLFKEPVTRQFDQMAQGPLFRTAMEGDALWALYLQSFPEGTNPLWRKRTEHDCSCCRHFIRDVGNVVSITPDNRLVTIWDGIYDTGKTSAYFTVAQALSRAVRSRPVVNVFRRAEARIGTDRNHGELDGLVATYEHFSVTVPRLNQTSHFCARGEEQSVMSRFRGHHDALSSSLKLLTAESAQTVLGLIESGDLYRGREKKAVVSQFLELKKEFEGLPPESHDNWLWRVSGGLPEAVSHIKNTAIGTLLEDISGGMDLEKAVDRWGKTVDPANYRRTTALVTQQMIEQARADFAAVGLSLARRHARPTDVSTADVLFRDERRDIAATEQDPFVTLAATAVKKNGFPDVPAVGFQQFLDGMLPGATGLEVMVEPRHLGNLVSLVAPAEQGTAMLTPWSSGITWAYRGDAADSIREKVKQAGGNVEGELCCRLAWHNGDDLDLHMMEPDNHIYFGNRGPSRSGGRLDVDMNAGGVNNETDPVENIFYKNTRTMRPGVYELSVHQFARRRTTDVGFEVEIDWRGDVLRLAHPQMVKQGQQVRVASLKWDGKEMWIKSLLEGIQARATRTMWGLRLNEWARVRAVLPSPNHWGEGGTGNRHLMFMLHGCRADQPVRGFFVEQLKPALDRHRKVLEHFGAQNMVPPTGDADDELSGLGFSDTMRNDVVIRLTRDDRKRILRVQF